MKSIRTTTIALVGTALLTLGALSGCSSDSDTSSDETTASQDSGESTDSDSKDSDSKDSGSADAASFDIDCDEYATVFSSVTPPSDPTDLDATADYYDDLAAEATGGLKNALEAMADAIRNPGDTAAVQRAADATQAWTDAAMECAAG